MFAVLAVGAAQAKDFLVVGTTFARIFEQTETGEFIALGAELALPIPTHSYPQFARFVEFVVHANICVIGECLADLNGR